MAATAVSSSIWPETTMKGTSMPRFLTRARASGALKCGIEWSLRTRSHCFPSNAACIASAVSTISESGSKPPRSKARSNKAASNLESSTISTRKSRPGATASAAFEFVLISSSIAANANALNLLQQFLPTFPGLIARHFIAWFGVRLFSSPHESMPRLFLGHRLVGFAGLLHLFGGIGNGRVDAVIVGRVEAIDRAIDALEILFRPGAIENESR